MRSYIKDTKHLIQWMEGFQTEPDIILATYDVSALYTNIPHDEARIIIENKLDSCPIREPPTHFLLELLDVIMEKNYFHVEDNFFQQIKGVAMGSACASSIANLFMETFEEKWIFNKTVILTLTRLSYGSVT